VNSWPGQSDSEVRDQRSDQSSEDRGTEPCRKSLCVLRISAVRFLYQAAEEEAQRRDAEGAEGRGQTSWGRD
jgi:hypothetical protein